MIGSLPDNLFHVPFQISFDDMGENKLPKKPRASDQKRKLMTINNWSILVGLKFNC